MHASFPQGEFSKVRKALNDFRTCICIVACARKEVGIYTDAFFLRAVGQIKTENPHLFQYKLS